MMSWKLVKNELDNDNLLINESLMALGNGYLGARGVFEEGYSNDFTSIRGTYVNAFYDVIPISYGEKLHGFPDTQQKMLNVIDSQTIKVYVDGEQFSLFTGEILEFSRTLHLDKGYAERKVHWKSPKGKELRLRFRRFISFQTKELYAMNVQVEALSSVDELKVVSVVDGDVSNFVDPNDPRVASGHAKRLEIVDVRNEEQYSTVKLKTYESKLEVACVTKTQINALDFEYESNVFDYKVEEVYTVKGEQYIDFTKYNVYTDTRRHEGDVVHAGKSVIQTIERESFEDLLEVQKKYMDQFWSQSDIIIKGDADLQQGLRFNLYHLLQSSGKDSVSNISAKGLSGEGYEGHYFWDTEIYMLPFFIMTNPEIAKGLLKHRYSLLEKAKESAKVVGHRQGALFPWRTISGGESSAFFPSGMAQYHISADISYSFIQYYLVTQDDEFLKEYMTELLFETARLWMDTGHLLDGEFRIDNVSGPDEYTCIVNNNYYTNAMAKHNLKWAAKSYYLLKEQDEEALNALMEKVQLHVDEVTQWETTSDNMYLPYDEELGISKQDDTFLQKDHWPIEEIPEENFPLLLHYHPLTLYRYQICKQADTVLAHFLLEDYQDLDTIQKSYDYYEEITTHDSSLSPCVFSIMASKLGYDEKAYDYFIETARLDLDNTHGNTKDGLHMANMGGTWLAIVYGFAGLRIKETGLSLEPSLPEQWEEIEFHLSYQQNLLHVKYNQVVATYHLVEGDQLSFKHEDDLVSLEVGQSVQLNMCKSTVLS